MTCFLSCVCNVCLCFQGTLSKSIFVMIFRILARPKRRKHNLIQISTHRRTHGRESERSRGDLFYTLPCRSLVNSTVFQAHYCRGVTVSCHPTTFLKLEIPTSTVQYSHEQSSIHICIYSPGGKVMVKSSCILPMGF